MQKQILKFIFILVFFFVLPHFSKAANFPLEIINIKPIGTENMASGNRIFRAYPGIEYNIRPAVIGGTYPFSFSFVANKPDWLNIDSADGTISGIAPSSGDFNDITIQVRDYEGATTNATWSISVGDTGFVFLSPTGNDTTGDGTLANPWQTMSKVYSDVTFYTPNPRSDWIVYYRGGNYILYNNDTGGDMYDGLSFWYSPNKWIAYPGEDVTIDMNDQVIDYRFSSNASYFDDLNFINMTRWGIRMASASNYDTIRRCDFSGLIGPDIGNNNYGYIFVTSSSNSTSYDGGFYHVIQDNKFHDYQDATAIGSIYRWQKMLIEDNEIYDAKTVISADITSAISIKAMTTRATVRKNYVHFDQPNVSVLGNGTTGVFVKDKEVEISHNRFLAASDTESSVHLNSHKSQFLTYFYRNTVRGRLGIKQLDINLPNCGPLQEWFDVSGYPQATAVANYSSESNECSGNGPFYINNNVIINNSTYGIRDANGVNAVQGWGGNTVNEYHPQDNLVGTDTGNIIDANGNLTAEYSQYFSSRGWQFGEADIIAPSAPNGLSVL